MLGNGRISVSTATLNGVRGVTIFVPEADIEAFCRELAREEILTDDGDQISLLADSFQEALSAAECRGFIDGEQYREQQARCEPL